MPYTVSHIEDGNIICISARGHLTIEDYKKGSQEVVDMLKKHSSLRLFVDDRLLHNVASIADLYDLTHFFYEIELPLKLRIAILIGINTTNTKDIVFFETACRNRGYNMQIFQSENEVFKWLQEK